MNYATLTDDELVLHADNITCPSDLELELTMRLRRALGEVEDLKREVESLTPPEDPQ